MNIQQLSDLLTEAEGLARAIGSLRQTVEDVNHGIRTSFRLPELPAPPQDYAQVAYDADNKNGVKKPYKRK